MLYSCSAVERAMQVKEVLMRAMNKEYSWLRAAEILGISLKTLHNKLKEYGAGKEFGMST